MDINTLQNEAYTQYKFPFDMVRAGSRIVIYGGDVVGKTFLRQIVNSSYCTVVGICDQNLSTTNIVEAPIISLAKLAGLNEREYDIILIATESRESAMEIRENLLLAGISEKKIRWCSPIDKHDKISQNSNHIYVSQKMNMLNAEENKVATFEFSADSRFEFPWNKIKKGERVIIYGGGVVGKTYLAQVLPKQYIYLVAVCDQAPESTGITSLPLIDRIKLKNMDSNSYDLILIANEKEFIANEIKESLCKVGIPEEKIVWYSPAVRYDDDDIEYITVHQIDETIKFSILTPLYNTPEKFLRSMIESVKNQTYGNWELCLVDASDKNNNILEKICQEYCDNDKRILYHRLDKNKGISDNTNRCADMATGDYFAFLDHDDVLDKDALYCNAKIILDREADVLYSDEDHLSEAETHILPLYKPDWSPDLLYCQNYVSHFLVVRQDLFYRLNGFRKEYDGAQDYDLILRLSLLTNRIIHIPEILYSWREHQFSTSVSSEVKPYAHDAGRRALNSFLQKKFNENAHADNGEYTFCYDARFPLNKNILVSIIVPMKDCYELTDACIKSIVRKSTYQNFEILIIDNNSRRRDTKKWLEKITEYDERIRIIPADMEFNWSKINNHGASYANGNVFIFLNNDTSIISCDWIERLSENALREEVGVVGGLLLYPDDRIQHAGVVVGMKGWAEHVFKNEMPEHRASPFISPMMNRNVMAVTGACMAVSRSTWDKIGSFDENFIICGSDVEYGIRAHRHHLFNIFNAHVKLYHLESKSRDSYIPKNDFDKSYEAYFTYKQLGDPYYNKNLDIQSIVPAMKIKKKKIVTGKQARNNIDYRISELEPIHGRKCKPRNRKRINFLIPSLDKAHAFGGISTILQFLSAFRKIANTEIRIIITDATYIRETSVYLDGDFATVDCSENLNIPLQIVPFADRYNKTIPVAPNDYFVATAWWTAYNIAPVIKWQQEVYSQQANPLIYFIQDFEPLFYSCSSRHILADSTYNLNFPIYAIINSKSLKDYFHKHGYSFTKEWFFTPKLNKKLKMYLPEAGKITRRKKQILVYGRPSAERNAFSILVYALKEWVRQQDDISEWKIISAGESFEDIDLGNGMKIHSVGKLPLGSYAELMLETYAGISLMISPHPSYPPLEMSTFGVKTLTNTYENKNLEKFNTNIVMLQNVHPIEVANKLKEICSGYDGTGEIEINYDYISCEDTFLEITQSLYGEFFL